MKNGTSKYKQKYIIQMTILSNNGKTKKEISTSKPYIGYPESIRCINRPKYYTGWFFGQKKLIFVINFVCI